MAKKKPENLFLLMYDLMTDPKVRQKFNANPYRVMRKGYRLKKKQTRIVFTLDPVKIGDECERLLDDFEFPNGEFPPIDEWCLEPAQVAAEYPVPTTKAFRIEPSSVSTGDENPTVIVRGQSFAPNATVISLTEDGGNATLPTSGTVTFGTFRCSGLRTSVDIENATAGDYVVKLIINPGQAEERTIATGLKLTLT